MLWLPAHINDVYLRCHVCCGSRITAVTVGSGRAVTHDTVHVCTTLHMQDAKFVSSLQSCSCMPRQWHHEAVQTEQVVTLRTLRTSCDTQIFCFSNSTMQAFEVRLWPHQHPLRQFEGILAQELLFKMENRGLWMERLQVLLFCNSLPTCCLHCTTSVFKLGCMRV